MDGKIFPISSRNGLVYLSVLPKENHREGIFEVLTAALQTRVTAADLRCAEGSTRPEFPELHVDANWTHSRDVCVLAFSRECKVGIDLEFHSRNRLKLAERFFSAEESDAIRRLQVAGDSDSALKMFYSQWCRKEAFYKCRGGDFFEGSLRRSLLDSLVEGVSLQDLVPKDYGIQGECSLCLATQAPSGT